MIRVRLAYRVQQVGKRTDCYTAVTAWKGEPCQDDRAVELAYAGAG